MGFGKLTGWGLMADAGIHLIVSFVIFGTNIQTFLDAKYNSEIAIYATILLAVSLLQGLYHFGLLLRTYCGGEEEELPVGSILRNLLTGIGIVSSWALFGKVGNDNTVVTLAVAFFCLMRFLDTIMNGKYDDYSEIGDLLKHSCKESEANLLENAREVVLFTPRVVMVHILLALAIASSAVDLSTDGGYLRPVADKDYTVALIFALVLQALHFLLYPFAAMFNYCGTTKGVMGGEVECKDGQGNVVRKELVSFNRIPIVRSVVAAVILSCLSFAYGKLTPEQPTRLLLLNLALYFGADQIGFDVV